MLTKKAITQRPIPRLTSQQLESELCLKSPDPKYIIDGINEEISCLQSEKNRLEAKYSKLVTEKKTLNKENSNLEMNIEELMKRISYLLERIKEIKVSTVNLSKDVSLAQKNVNEFKTMLLSGEESERKMKELRQLEIKKTITVKKLQTAQKIIPKTDFTNLKEALQMYQEDINTLELNNMRIEQQIDLVSKQVQSCYNTIDQQKLKELKSSKDEEIQNLLRKIRDAKRKDTTQQIQPEEGQVVIQTQQEPVSKTLFIKKIRKQDLLFENEEEFNEMKKQLSILNDELENLLLHNRRNPNMTQYKRREIIKIRSEIGTIKATIEGEEKRAIQDIQNEEKVQNELDKLDATIQSRKDELESMRNQNTSVLTEIDLCVKNKGQMRKDLDELLQYETNEIQILMREIRKYCKKCEEGSEKLNDEETQLTSRREQLADIKSSKEIAQYNALMDQKAEIENETQQLRNVFKQSPEITNETMLKLQEMQKKKDVLLNEYQKYEKIYKVDKEEVEELQNYSNTLLCLINEARKNK